MRVVFAGTPAFAVPALESLVHAGHDVVLVLTQPDRPAGRGQRLTPSPVSLAARRLGLKEAKPESLKPPESVRLLKEADPDVMVVAAYGLILPPSFLAIPRLGCINIHASLLPRWRGAAPVHRAILAGDDVTGISIMQMEAGLDTGPVLLERTLPIGSDDTTGSLTEKLGVLGGEAIVEALARPLAPRPQDSAKATYAAKVEKREARIDWSQPAAHIARQVRAFNPSPGAEGELRGLLLKIWEARPLEGTGLEPGQVRTTGGRLIVGCGTGAVEVGRLQRPGGRRMAPEEFLRGDPWAATRDDHAST